MNIVRKKDFPPAMARQILEPGPIVLVTSRWRGRDNIMTMGWHTVMEFTPALFGCVIAESNGSFEMIKRSGECVINVPDKKLINQVVGIGTSSGDDIDKFQKFKLTSAKSTKVDVPLIKECFANFECRIYDKSLIKKYNFFIFEIVKGHLAETPEYPQTLHYHGEGLFTLSGKKLDLRKRFHDKSL